MTLEEALVEHCSPTLAGVKAGNMFRYVAHRSENIRTLIRDCEKEMSKDIKISILKYCIKTSSYLLYVLKAAVARGEGDLLQLTFKNSCRAISA